MTGFEPLIGAAAAGLGGLITNLVKDKGTETLKKIDWDIGKNLAVKKALVDYVRRYIDRHGTLKVACVRMDYPVRLDEIYTAVQLLDRSALRYFESEDALQEQYRESGKRGFNGTRAEKKPGLQVANEQQYLMVLGGPGVGKSTFLRKVGLEALRTLGRRDFAGKDPSNLLVPQGIFYQHPRIPVMLELRQFDKANVSIQAVIAAELETCGFPEAEELTELFLKNGKLLVLLDGLDEVPAVTLDHVLKEIRSLVDRYSDNRYIASCRVAAYTFGGFTRFKDVAMAAFEDEQIQQFIQNWFQKERDTETNTAERCWELLNSDDYQAAKELAQTPLLLTLLCVVYDEFQDFPKKRHALYGEALDVLLRKWASEKRIQRNAIYQELSTELELSMLAEIAYSSFFDDQLFFPKDFLINQIRLFLMENLNAPSYLDAETVLKEIEIQQGILVERARNTYSFSHLTFQEYLTAKYIVDNQEIEKIILYHAVETHWREIFLLVSGLVPGRQGANNLLMNLEIKTKSYVQSNEFKELIIWSRQIIEISSEPYKTPAKCIAAIVFIKSISTTPTTMTLSSKDSLCLASCALGIDAPYYSVQFDAHSDCPMMYVFLDVFAIIDKYISLNIFRQEPLNIVVRKLKALEKCVDKDSLSSENLSPDYRQEIFDKILEVIYGNLNLNSSVMSLFVNKSKSIDNYFYLLELMIRCKESAMRVSPHVWTDIESRMFTVPTE